MLFSRAFEGVGVKRHFMMSLFGKQVCDIFLVHNIFLRVKSLQLFIPEECKIYFCETELSR